MRTSECIKEIKESIDTPGKWVQGIGKWNNSMCLVTAIWQHKHSLLSEDSDKLVKKSIGILYPKFILLDQEAQPYIEIVCFNDNTSTTHEMVILVLDRAIQMAEESELEAGIEILTIKDSYNDPKPIKKQSKKSKNKPN